MVWCITKVGMCRTILRITSAFSQSAQMHMVARNMRDMAVGEFNKKTVISSQKKCWYTMLYA